MTEKTFLDPDAYEAFVGNAAAPLDLSKGGQQGAMVSNFQWTSLSAHVAENIIPVLVSVPGLMQYSDNPELETAILQQLVEVMSTNVVGLNSTLNVSYGDNKVGDAGETFEFAIQTLRTKSVPEFTWQEKKNQAVANFWARYIKMYVRDPDLQRPGATAWDKYIEAGSPQIDASDVTFSMLFFEPDETLTRVVNAWLVTNMSPNTSGPIEGTRTKGEARANKDVVVSFTGMTADGNIPRELALKHLAKLNLADQRPADLRVFSEVLSADGGNLDDVTTADVAASAEGFLNKAKVGDAGVMTAGT